MKNNSGIKSIIQKKAEGYLVDEIIEEFVEDGGELVLKKKKVTTKHIPPDMSAVKFLMEMEKGLEDISDEELKAERERLLEKIKKELNSGDKTNKI